MLNNILADLNRLERRILSCAPMGFALAVNIRRFTPEFYHTTYPAEWVKIYHDRRYALFDPTTIWARFHEGSIRWSEIQLPAVQRVGRYVLDHAARFDLKYGGGVSAVNRRDPDGPRCLLFGARADREMTDAELEELSDILATVMAAVGEHAGLTDVEVEALRDLASGLTHNEIADLRGVSPSTIKKRLERAREVLGAKNAVHAVALATKRGLVLPDPII